MTRNARAGIHGLLLLALLALAPASAQAQLRMQGEAEQGGLVVGSVAPGSEVLLNEKALRIGEDGTFVIGFDRDAEPEARLEVRHANGVRELRTLRVQPRDWKIERIDGLPQKKVTPNTKALKRIRAEAALIRKARKRDTAEALFASGFLRPVPGRISGVFGSQRILNGQPRSPHSGTDYAAPAGTPVRATADGVVSLVHEDMYFTGKTVMIDHGHGLASVYAHMSDIAVKEGARVRQGDVIGAVGASGRATGPHLHFGISWRDIRLDPETVLAVLPAESQAALRSDD